MIVVKQIFEPPQNTSRTRLASAIPMATQPSHVPSLAAGGRSPVRPYGRHFEFTIRGFLCGTPSIELRFWSVPVKIDACEEEDCAQVCQVPRVATRGDK